MVTEDVVNQSMVLDQLPPSEENNLPKMMVNGRMMLDTPFTRTLAARQRPTAATAHQERAL